MGTLSTRSGVFDAEGNEFCVARRLIAGRGYSVEGPRPAAIGR